MGTPRVVRVGNLAEFMAEVKPPFAAILPGFERPSRDPNGNPWFPVRLSVIDREVGAGVIPWREIALHLQGINDLNETVWLVESHRVVRFPSGPETSLDASIAAGMMTAYDLVRAHLIGAGYEVRAGSYGFPKDVEPVRGDFECIRWRKVDEGRFVAEAVAAEQEAGN